MLDAAKAQGLRTGENPARWRGHLDQLLPKRQRLTRGNHAAMSYGDVPAFIGDLQSRDATAALALEFTILTAARRGEVLGARWQEFDLERAVWIVPAHRMKAGREHRVPLSGRALAIVKALRQAAEGREFVFGGHKPGKPLSGEALGMVLRRMKIDDVTVHGFRSSFRDWAAECQQRTHLLLRSGSREGTQGRQDQGSARIRAICGNGGSSSPRRKACSAARVRHATEWRLTEFASDVSTAWATREFEQWRPRNSKPRYLRPDLRSLLPDRSVLAGGPTQRKLEKRPSTVPVGGPEQAATVSLGLDIN